MDARGKRARRQFGEGDGGDRAGLDAARQQHGQAPAISAVLPVPAAASTSKRRVEIGQSPQAAGAVGERRHRQLQTREKSPKARPKADCLSWK